MASELTGSRNNQKICFGVPEGEEGGGAIAVRCGRQDGGMCSESWEHVVTDDRDNSVTFTCPLIHASHLPLGVDHAAWLARCTPVNTI